MGSLYADTVNVLIGFVAGSEKTVLSYLSRIFVIHTPGEFYTGNAVTVLIRSYGDELLLLLDAEFQFLGRQGYLLQCVRYNYDCGLSPVFEAALPGNYFDGLGVAARFDSGGQETIFGYRACRLV